MRLHEPQMKSLRNALVASKLDPTPLPDREYWIGRHPA